MRFNAELYADHLKRWKSSSVNEAINQLEEIEPASFEVAEIISIQTSFFKNSDVLFIYGIETGDYSFLTAWLSENPRHHIVFLEDDLSVLKAFLGSPHARVIVDNAQISLYYWIWEWERAQRLADSWSATFAMQKLKILANPRYLEQKPQHFKELENLISYTSHNRNRWLTEFLHHGSGFFKNFYRNIFRLPQAYLGKQLFGKFQNVPAIICGAGPSLVKNQALLKELKDKALIFAGSSAINTLNAQGIQPHFSVLIDPNPIQMTRTIANQAYEVPLLYRNRVYHKALDTIQGPKVYINQAGGYRITDWLEKQLGIECETEIEEGFNVVNFSLNLAYLMGCSPLICVGVDLAYTEGKSYPDGILQHALKDTKTDFQTKDTSEELIERKDIFGNPIYTLWKWIEEANWYSAFALKYPNAIILNCTEGGLGFTGIPNLPLKQVVDHFCQKEYDLIGWIHAELEKEKMASTVNQEKLLSLLEELIESLAHCESYYLEIRNHCSIMLSQIEKGALDDSKAAALLDQIGKQLWQEIAYQYIFEGFEKALADVYQKKLELLNRSFAEDQKMLLKNQWTLKYTFATQLWESVLFNLTVIQDILYTAQRAQTPLISTVPSPYLGCYEYQQPRLKIHDEELGIDVEEEVALRAEATKTTLQYFKEEERYGPSIFYDDLGTVLVKSWYYQGKRHGKTIFYSSTGQILAVLNFLNGQKQGLHHYYSPHGLLRTELPYLDDELNGTVKLYNESGHIKRELQFCGGKLNGIERGWSAKGVLIFEGEYRDNGPIGIAKQWNEEGELIKEVIYQDRGYLIRRLENGEWKEQVHEDYFDVVTRQTGVLTDSLEVLLQSIDKLSAFSSAPDIQSDLAEIHKQMQKLKDLQEVMTQESGLLAKPDKEPLWKSLSARDQIEHSLGQATAEMSKNLNQLQDFIFAQFGIKPKDPSGE